MFKARAGTPCILPHSSLFCKGISRRIEEISYAIKQQTTAEIKASARYELLKYWSPNIFEQS